MGLGGGLASNGQQATGSGGSGASVPGGADPADTSRVTAIHGGQLVVRNEKLSFDDPIVGGVVNDGTDQSAAISTFVAKVNAAAGGVGVFPPGVIKFTPPATPWTLGGVGATTSARIEGAGGGGMPSGGATQLVALSDSGSSPFTNPVFAVGGGSGGDWALEKISLSLHQRFGPGSGIIPANAAGIQIGGNGKVRDVDVSNASAALIVAGDHLVAERIAGSGNGVGIAVKPSLNTQGDIKLSVIQLSGKLATFLLPASSMLGGMNADRVTGAGEPFYILRYNDGATASQDALDGVSWVNCGVESIWHGLYYDELVGTSNAGAVQRQVWTPAPNGSGIAYSATTDANTWMTSITGATVSAATVTVTVPAGFWVRPGMVIVDASGKIAAGTTVTSIASGSWPGTSYTLNLSSTPSGNPTGAITLMMPQVAVIAAGLYVDNKYQGAYLNGGYGSLPVHLVNWFNGNTGETDATNLVSAVTGGQPYVTLNSGLYGSQHARGNSFGAPEGSMGPHVTVAQPQSAVAQYDVVEYATGNSGMNVAPATGQGRYAGVALRAGSSGAIELVTTSDSATVKNKSANAIASGALLKIDTANPGGVAAASGPTDGHVIGKATAPLSANGGTGTALLHGPIGASSGLTRLPGPDGNPTGPATADVARAPVENQVVTYRSSVDTLFAPNPQTEVDVLNDGGVLYGNQTGYFAQSSYPRAGIVSLPLRQRKGFQLGPAPISGSAFGVPIFSLDGILSLARFQITVDAYPSGAFDLAAYGTNQYLFYATWGQNAPCQMYLQVSSGSLQAQMAVNDSSLPGGSNNSLLAQLTLSQPLASATVATTASSTSATVTIPASQAASGTTTASSNSVSWTGTGTPTVNMLIAGTGIPSNTYVTAVSGSSGAWTLTISNNASASGTNSLTLTSGTPAVGMWVSSQNIPAGTYISAVSGTGPYTVTLSNAALATASGTAINGSDVPATASGAQGYAVPIVLAFDGNTLTLRLANNTRNAASGSYAGSSWLRRTPSADNRVKAGTGLILLNNSTHASDKGLQVGVTIEDVPQTPTFSTLVDRVAKVQVDASTTSVTGTGNTTNTSKVIQSFAPTTVAPYPGMAVAGTGIPVGTTIAPNGVFGPKADGTYQLTLSAAATATNTGVTLTCTPTSFPQYLAGIVKPYSAWTNNTVATENADPGAGWRAAQCSLIAGLGIKVIRDADYHLRAIPTLSATPGQIASVDPTGVYDRLDRIHTAYGGSAGVAATTPWRLHLTHSYCPAALGGTSGNSYHDVPHAPQTGSATSTTSSTSITGYTGPTPQVGQILSGLGLPAPLSASATTTASSQSVSYTGTTAPTVGSVITGVGIPLDATITAVSGSSGAYTLTISSPASLSGTVTVTISPAVTAVTGTSGNYTITSSVASSAGATGTLTVYWTYTQSFQGYGAWAVQVLQGINSRYPGVLFSTSVWNEPENTWNIGAMATVDNYAQLWLTTAQAIQTANITVAEGQLYAGGVDGEYATSASSAHGTGGNGGDYQRQMLALAQSNSQHVAALYLHSYDAATAVMVENMHGLTAEASTRSVTTAAGATPPVRVSEINFTLNYGGTTQTLLWGHHAKDLLGPSVVGAAYLLRAAWEIANAGGDMLIVYRGAPPSTYSTATISEEVLGVIGASANPRAWPQGAALELLAKTSGTRVACATNKPYLFSFASVSGSTTTVVVGAYRQYQPREQLPVQFEYTNLPGGWTKWKLWRMDYRDYHDGRPVLISQGDTTNLPGGTDLTANGVLCLQLS